MKTATIALLLFLCFAGRGWSQEEPKKPMKKLEFEKRYGYEQEPKRYPQKTPRDTLESIIKAIVDENMEYMMAHLADPEYVDGKVGSYEKTVNVGELMATALGATFETPDAKLAQKLPQNLGLVIRNIRPDTPAATRFNEGDVLLQINGRNVLNQLTDLHKLLGEFKGGGRAEAVVVRDEMQVAIRGLILPDVDTPNNRRAFRRLVQETTSLFFDDAARIQDLRRFARDADWQFEEDRAIGTVKQLGNRQVILRLREERWFLENRQSKEK